MENYVVTTNNNYINLDYISFGNGGGSSSDGAGGVSSSGIMTTTIDCSTSTITTAGTTYDSTTFTYDPSLHGTITFDPTFQFNDWTYNPGFTVDLGDGDDVHYSHEEVTEALKEHHNEKKLREEHKMLEKAYKEYKMLARLLQVDIEEEE